MRSNPALNSAMGLELIFVDLKRAQVFEAMSWKFLSLQSGGEVHTANARSCVCGCGGCMPRTKTAPNLLQGIEIFHTALSDCLHRRVETATIAYKYVLEQYSIFFLEEEAPGPE